MRLRGDGLPIGLQLTGRMFDEATLLRVADAYERVTDWHTQTPPLASEPATTSSSEPRSCRLFEPGLQRVDWLGSVSPTFIGVTDT